jgi:hypothetical protein
LVYLERGFVGLVDDQHATIHRRSHQRRIL